MILGVALVLRYVLIYFCYTSLCVCKIDYLSFAFFLPSSAAFHNPGCILGSPRNLSENNLTSKLYPRISGEESGYQHFFLKLVA